MNPVEVDRYLEALDGRGSDAEFKAVDALSTLGDEFPTLLLAKYRNSKKWGARASCVYHSFGYAQSHNEAFQLGVEATQDRSKHVRYRACMLLAISQRQDAIVHLTKLLSDCGSADDAKAAIDAIEQENHHYFVDRDHSGMVTLNIATRT